MSEQLLQDLLLTRSIANEFKIISTEQEQHAWEVSAVSLHLSMALCVLTCPPAGDTRI